MAEPDFRAIAPLLGLPVGEVLVRVLVDEVEPRDLIPVPVGLAPPLVALAALLCDPEGTLTLDEEELPGRDEVVERDTVPEVAIVVRVSVLVSVLVSAPVSVEVVSKDDRKVSVPKTEDVAVASASVVEGRVDVVVSVLHVHMSNGCQHREVSRTGMTSSPDPDAEPRQWPRR